MEADIVLIHFFSGTRRFCWPGGDLSSRNRNRLYRQTSWPKLGNLAQEDTALRRRPDVGEFLSPFSLFVRSSPRSVLISFRD